MNSSELATQMLRTDRRPPSIAQTISELAAQERAKARRSSPLASSPKASEHAAGPTLSVTPNPTPKPYGITQLEWIEDVLHRQHGVIAALPTLEGAEPCTLALDSAVAGGHADFWMTTFATAACTSNTVTNLAPVRSRVVHVKSFAVATLECNVPSFVPDGASYGHASDKTDALLDSGIRIDFNRVQKTERNGDAADGGGGERGGDEHGRTAGQACAKELSMLCEAAVRGIAPCVLAAFYTQGVPDLDAWFPYKKPTDAIVDTNLCAPREPRPISGMVVVGQLSTFTLDDLMQEYRTATVTSRKAHLRRVLVTVCGPVFDKLNELSAVHAGHGIFKANMHPDTIAFCPELLPDGDSWKLNGYGYDPISSKHIDGMPKLTSFGPAYTTRVRSASYSADTALVAHCLLLVAFTRAQHGADVSEVLWQHVLSEGDPSGVVAAARRVKSCHTNASNFLAWLASNFELQHVHEVVSDLDRCLIRHGLVGSDGQLGAELQGPYFNKLVALVTGSTGADTHIFERGTDVDSAADLTEAEQLAALESVKRQRRARLGVGPRS